MATNSAMAELTYQSPMSFEDYYHMNSGFGYSSSAPKNGLQNPNSFLSKIDNFFTGRVTNARQAYENYLSQVEANNNAYYAQEANKKTWQREDTETQRKVADIEATGLNPYLFFTSGSMGGVSSQAQSSSFKRASSKKEESKIASSALKILAIIALKSMM